MTKQQQIETMQRELRELREELARYKSNYGTLADLASDIVSAQRYGQDTAPAVDALSTFAWKD